MPPLRSRTYPIAVLLALVLSACGQKGPLYLPQDSQAEPTTGAQANERDDDDDTAAPASARQ